MMSTRERALAARLADRDLDVLELQATHVTALAALRAEMESVRSACAAAVHDAREQLSRATTHTHAQEAKVSALGEQLQELLRSHAQQAATTAAALDKRTAQVASLAKALESSRTNEANALARAAAAEAAATAAVSGRAAAELESGRLRAAVEVLQSAHNELTSTVLELQGKLYDAEQEAGGVGAASSPSRRDAQVEALKAALQSLSEENDALTRGGSGNSGSAQRLQQLEAQLAAQGKELEAARAELSRRKAPPVQRVEAWLEEEDGDTDSVGDGF